MSSFDEQWNIIDSTFTRVACCTIAEYSFQTLYDTVYKLVRQNHGDMLFDRLHLLISKRVSAAIEKIASSPIDAVLLSLSETWKFHILTISRTSDFLFFFNKHYCKPRNMPTVTELGTSLFREHLLPLDNVCRRIRDAFIDRVQKERRGEICCFDTLFNVSQVLHQINGLHVVQNAYLEELQKAQSGLAQIVSSSPVCHFVQEYNDQLAKERRLCVLALGERSLPPIESLMQDVWLLHFRDKMISMDQMRPLLASQDEEKLRIVFVAYEQVGEADSFNGVVRQFLGEEVAQCTSDVAGVERILALEAFMRRIKEVVLKSERPSRRAELLSRSFQDAVARIGGFPDAMASYLESRNRATSDEVTYEKAIDDVISLFKILSDKDLFEAAYKSYLAKRLLTAGLTQHDEDRERLFVSKFKREIGCNFTSRIEGMFADRKSSDEINNNFKEFMLRKPLLSYDMSVLVLTSGFWPQFPTSPSSPLSELQCGMEAFCSFYAQRHSSRRLEFCVNQGSCDIKVHCGKKLDVQMPLNCAATLFLYQQEEIISANEVSSRLNIAISDAVRSLMTLMRQNQNYNGLLCCDGRTVNPSTKFWFNTEIRSKATKFRIFEVNVKEKSKPDVVRERNDDDRKFKIDAAIVRIMKSRRNLDHHSLVSEVQRAASTSFEATHDEIKKRIEHLLEREFIMRNVDVPGWYIYVA